jgi:hypothetical protein
LADIADFIRAAAIILSARFRNTDHGEGRLREFGGFCGAIRFPRAGSIRIDFPKMISTKHFPIKAAECL